MVNWAVAGDGLLEVSSDGQVRTRPRLCRYLVNGLERTQLRNPKALNPWVAHNGYRHISLKGEDGFRRKLLVHRLVASAFVPGWFEGASVNHIDGDKLNNSADNLEWVTLAENTRKQWADGLVDLRGEKHPLSKLTNNQTQQILNRITESPALLAREFGVSPSLIYKIRRGSKRVWPQALPR